MKRILFTLLAISSFGALKATKYVCDLTKKEFDTEKKCNEKCFVITQSWGTRKTQGKCTVK